jgi:hypothetical protein
MLQLICNSREPHRLLWLSLTWAVLQPLSSSDSSSIGHGGNGLVGQHQGAKEGRAQVDKHRMMPVLNLVQPSTLAPPCYMSPLLVSIALVGGMLLHFQAGPNACSCI